MWKRILNVFFKRSHKESIEGTLNASPLQKYIDPTQTSKLEAQITFRNVLRELGGDEIRKEMRESSQGSKIRAVNNNSIAPEKMNGEELEELARSYFEGNNNFPQDVYKAYTLWDQASQLGNVEATYSKAVCLREGKGVQRNTQEGFHLLKELAEKKNYMLAHYAVGVMYSAGEGTLVNDEKAFEHFLVVLRLFLVLI